MEGHLDYVTTIVYNHSVRYNAIRFLILCCFIKPQMSIICLIFYKGIQYVALLYDECKGNYFIIIVFTVEDIYTRPTIC